MSRRPPQGSLWDEESLAAPGQPPVVPPPRDEAELVARANQLAGLSLAQLAGRHGVAVPPDLRRAKGWVGGLLERALGATAGSRDCPDFEAIGVELKSLPVDGRGRPCESTFVCTVPLREVGEVPWERSRVRRKLARVLWVPVQGLRALPVGERRIGTALLWSPDADQEGALRFDWEELAGIMGRGDIESLTGHVGRHLQVRPKAAHSRVRTRSIDTEGALINTLPRGFYLRPAFTGAILQQHFVLPR